VRAGGVHVRYSILQQVLRNDLRLTVVYGLFFAAIRSTASEDTDHL
jgi:hypothetical protein